MPISAARPWATALENGPVLAAAHRRQLYFETGRWRGASLAAWMTAIGRYEKTRITANCSHPIVREIATPMTGLEAQQSSADGSSKGAISKPVVRGVAVLVDLRGKPCVRSSISRTGAADPYTTFMRTKSQPQRRRCRYELRGPSLPLGPGAMTIAANRGNKIGKAVYA